MSNWDGSGYSAEASSGGGIFLRLKKKGEKVRVRIVSEPYRYTDTFEDKEKNETKILRKVAWLVIHKEIVDGKPFKSVKVFTQGPMVYGVLKDLAENPDWGDPTTYDITVERTEESGKYYVVTPLPKPIGPITDEEQALVDESPIDFPACCTGSSSGPSHTDSDAPADHDPFE